MRVEQTSASLEMSKKKEQELLDHFAGLAMNGELSRITYQEHGRQYSNFEGLAKKAYKIAAAMLKARKEVK